MILVVSPGRPELYEWLGRDFAGVETVLDRRKADRRQRKASPSAERRRADRRLHAPDHHELLERGWSMVRIPRR